MLIDTLEKQHQELLEASGSILAAMPDGEVFDAPAVRNLLLRFMGKLTVHLVTEDEQVYPTLLNHKDSQVRATTERLRSELGGLAQAVDKYKAIWTSVVSIQKQPAEFTHHTRLLLAALAKRIQQEDEELYVLLKRP